MKFLEGWDDSLARNYLISLLIRFQSVQNAAGRLVSVTRRRDHITPVLQQLHWLPVRPRVEFKLTLLAYKAMHALLPPYLASDCQLVTAAGRRHLRSSDVPIPWRSRERPRHLATTASSLEPLGYGTDWTAVEEMTDLCDQNSRICSTPTRWKSPATYRLDRYYYQHHDHFIIIIIIILYPRPPNRVRV